jgi:hypothetical protein
MYGRQLQSIPGVEQLGRAPNHVVEREEKELEEIRSASMVLVMLTCVLMPTLVV